MGHISKALTHLNWGGRGKIIVSDIGTIKNVDVTQGGITVNEGTKVTVFFLKLFAKLQETKSSGGLDLNGLGVQRVLAADEQPTLDGNGTIVGNVIIGDQGHMAPGNSIGTFNIEGSYTQEAGGTFDLELDTRTQTNDMLNVIGTASIAGTLDVMHNLWRRDMALGDQLTFLTATDGVTGTFDRLTNADSLFFVQFAPVYTDTSVSVELVRDSFVLPDLNSHQQALGSALDILAASVDAGAATIREAAFIDDMTWTLKREVAPYMDQLLSQTAVQLATPSLMAKEAFMGRVSNSAILMQANTADIGTWTSNADVYRDYGDMEATGLGNAYKFQTTGGMTSLAYKYSEALNLGFALGGSATSYGGDLRFGKNGRDSLDGAFFAGYHHEGTQLAASVGFSLDDYDTARNIRTAHSNLYAEGDGSGTALSANLKAQQDMVFGNMWVSAMAGMNISQLSQKAFSETGADSVGLSFGKDSSTSAKASLGLRVSRTFTSGMNTTLRPVVGVYVDREFAGLNRDRTAHMLAAPDVVFNVVGATVDRNTIRGEFGFETIISNSVRLNLSYQNSFNKAYNVQQVGASLSWRW